VARAAQDQALSNLRNFEGDIVAALFGNPHGFGGFPAPRRRRAAAPRSKMPQP